MNLILLNPHAIAALLIKIAELIGVVIVAVVSLMEIAKKLFGPKVIS